MKAVIAPRACSDIEAILAWTQDNFGPQIVDRYARLIETAIYEVSRDPDCPGNARRAEIAENCRTYHLFHACKKAAARGQRIRKPRHFLLYRVRDDGVVEIGRVLHDSMDMEQHLPTEYQASPEAE